VGSFFSFYLKISIKLGLEFARNQYKIFVEEAKVFSTTPLKIIKDKQKRRSIFFVGIKKGIKATEIQTGKNYQKVWETITKELANK
jgi:hypothetical protein